MLDNLKSLWLYLNGVQTAGLGTLILYPAILDGFKVAQVCYIYANKSEYELEHIKVLALILLHRVGE